MVTTSSICRFKMGIISQTVEMWSFEELLGVLNLFEIPYFRVVPSYRSSSSQYQFEYFSYIRRNIFVSNILSSISRHLLCPIPSCNEIFADKDLLTKHLETDHAKIDPSQQPAPKRVYAGKYNCYFEGCNEYFDDAEVSLQQKNSFLFLFLIELFPPPTEIERTFNQHSCTVAQRSGSSK